MKLERTKLDALTCDPANVRKHDQRNLDAIKASLQRFGQQHPIIVDAAGVIRAGNGRYMAMRALGWSECDIVRTDLKGSEATAFAIADNRTAELATWDDDALAQQLAALQIEDEALALATGYDAKEIEALALDASELVEDEVPEPPADPITKPGDLWLLGEHRLLCGDSTKAEDVRRLMASELADLTFTDPPYGISLGVETPEQAKAHNRRTDGKIIENDNLKGERLAEFLTSALAIVDHHLRPGGAFYVCSPIGVEVRKFIQAIEAAKWHYQTGLVWNKNSLSLSRFDYQPKHEIIHYGWKGGAAHKWRSDRTQTSVIDHAKPSKSEDHPTTKPVQLVAYFISNVSDGRDIVLDPFLGSGTTLIAAEQLGRTCYGMEISPAYCDVIVNRWETLTGRKATRA